MSRTADQALNALERATRDALTVVSPEHILRVVQELADADARQSKTESLGALLDEMDGKCGSVPAELIEQARREWPDHVDE